MLVDTGTPTFAWSLHQHYTGSALGLGLTWAMPSFLSFSSIQVLIEQSTKIQMLKPEEWFQKGRNLWKRLKWRERRSVHICIPPFIQSSSDYFISSSLFNECNPTTPQAYTLHSLSLEIISLCLLQMLSHKQTDCSTLYTHIHLTNSICQFAKGQKTRSSLYLPCCWVISAPVPESSSELWGDAMLQLNSPQLQAAELPSC